MHVFLGFNYNLSAVITAKNVVSAVFYFNVSVSDFKLSRCLRLTSAEGDVNRAVGNRCIQIKVGIFCFGIILAVGFAVGAFGFGIGCRCVFRGIILLRCDIAFCSCFVMLL